MDFKSTYDGYLEVVSKALNNFLTVKETPEKNIYEAMIYSLMAGGKRLRPVLALAVCDLLGGDKSEVVPFACAIEMIHTYSLIHDDLPAMDNDDYRRGRLTNHKIFGEAKAILAGDALLNYAFEVMTAHSIKNQDNLPAKVMAMDIIARAAGASGMIGGQVVDLEAEGKDIPLEILEYMHRCKTGALIKAPVMAAAVLCNASKSQMADLEIYAKNIGLAFQIKDDILDIEGDSEMMGKKTGSDIANKKSTFVSVYGLEESRIKLAEITNQAIERINAFGEKGFFLKNLAEYLVKRDK